MSNTDRYNGKPMLRLLECYTLRAIGQLETEYETMMAEMAPNFQSVYKVNGEWHEIIEKVMELPPHMPELIRDMWNKNQEIALQNNTTLSPQTFAEMFVDQNLT